MAKKNITKLVKQKVPCDKTSELYFTDAFISGRLGQIPGAAIDRPFRTKFPNLDARVSLSEGEYPDNEIALQKIVHPSPYKKGWHGKSWDGTYIPKGMKLIIYMEKNFKGQSKEFEAIDDDLYICSAKFRNNFSKYKSGGYNKGINLEYLDTTKYQKGSMKIEGACYKEVPVEEKINITDESNLQDEESNSVEVDSNGVTKPSTEISSPSTSTTSKRINFQLKTDNNGNIIECYSYSSNQKIPIGTVITLSQNGEVCSIKAQENPEMTCGVSTGELYKPEIDEPVYEDEESDTTYTDIAKPEDDNVYTGGGETNTGNGQISTGGGETNTGSGQISTGDDEIEDTKVECETIIKEVEKEVPLKNDCEDEPKDIYFTDAYIGNKKGNIQQAGIDLPYDQYGTILSSTRLGIGEYEDTFETLKPITDPDNYQSHWHGKSWDGTYIPKGMSLTVYKKKNFEGSSEEFVAWGTDIYLCSAQFRPNFNQYIGNEGGHDYSEGITVLYVDTTQYQNGSMKIESICTATKTMVEEIEEEECYEVVGPPVVEPEEGGKEINSISPELAFEWKLEGNKIVLVQNKPTYTNATFPVNIRIDVKGIKNDSIQDHITFLIDDTCEHKDRMINKIKEQLKTLKEYESKIKITNDTFNFKIRMVKFDRIGRLHNVYNGWINVDSCINELEKYNNISNYNTNDASGIESYYCGCASRYNKRMINCKNINLAFLRMLTPFQFASITQLKVFPNNKGAFIMFSDFRYCNNQIEYFNFSDSVWCNFENDRFNNIADLYKLLNIKNKDKNSEFYMDININYIDFLVNNKYNEYTREMFFDIIKEKGKNSFISEYSTDDYEEEFKENYPNQLIIRDSNFIIDIINSMVPSFKIYQIISTNQLNAGAIKLKNDLQNYADNVNGLAKVHYIDNVPSIEALIGDNLRQTTEQETVDGHIEVKTNEHGLLIKKYEWFISYDMEDVIKIVFNLKKNRKSLVVIPKMQQPEIDLPSSPTGYPGQIDTSKPIEQNIVIRDNNKPKVIKENIDGTKDITY